ncbi:MAG: hypothetical protein WC590_12775 [Burkholderiaceae bacterium]
MSVLLPGEKGTTNLMGWAGYSRDDAADARLVKKTVLPASGATVSARMKFLREQDMTELQIRGQIGFE